MLIHEILKIKYVKEGYLIEYPPHLISDEEMFYAFIHDGTDEICYFDSTYPCPNESMRAAYNSLRSAILAEVNKVVADSSLTLPDWVYSYMLGAVIGPNSPQEERHDLLSLLNRDNTYDTLTDETYADVLNCSSKWVKRYTEPRVPTMFGEPHVMKALRVYWSDLTREVRT